MAKKIKFPLVMKDDVQVRDLEELKEHFDIDKAIGYFLDGKLLTWLEARYYDTEAEAVRGLNKDDADVHRRLCEIFGVEYHAEEAPEIDMEALEERNQRLTELKQYTSDAKILENVDHVAFDQEELANLLDDGVREIYLCNNSFTIPLRIENTRYIGVGKAEAVIRSSEEVDFAAKGIVFENVKFDEAYENAIRDTPEKIFQQGQDAESQENNDAALQLYMKGAELGHTGCMRRIGAIIANEAWRSTNNDAEICKAYAWYQKAADLGDSDAMADCGRLCFHNQRALDNWDYKKSYQWFAKAAELGNTRGMCGLGDHFYNGRGLGMADYTQAGLEWYRKAVNMGDKSAMANLATIYFNGKHMNGTGVERNMQVAEMWLNAAHAAGWKGSYNEVGIPCE